MEWYFKGELRHEDEIYDEIRNNTIVDQILSSISINQTYLDLNIDLTPPIRLHVENVIEREKIFIDILKNRIKDKDIISDNIETLKLLERNQTIHLYNLPPGSPQVKWDSFWIMMYEGWINELHKVKNNENVLKLGR